jgi:hypothetical protein
VTENEEIPTKFKPNDTNHPPNLILQFFVKNFDLFPSFSILPNSKGFSLLAIIHIKVLNVFLNCMFKEGLQRKKHVSNIITVVARPGCESFIQDFEQKIKRICEYAKKSIFCSLRGYTYTLMSPLQLYSVVCIKHNFSAEPRRKVSYSRAISVYY